MQLHVLGPAFGLPSIDAECLAAIALLQLHQPAQWQIIPTSDPSRRLPWLKDGEEILEGFNNIARRIESLDLSNAGASIDTRRADSIAISSFLQSQAQPLLDVSLYVSHENYSTTRSAFTKILPWYWNYTIPPARQAAARKRTEHLGISSIDIDDVHEDLSNRPATFDVGKEPKFEAETKKRASLLLSGRNTVRSLLQRPEHSAVFKLHAIADNFFQPLQDMLGDHEYFLGTEGPQTVDCLVYGYLSLMLYPNLLQDWLAKAMRRKYPKLVRFTENIHERLRLHTNVDAVGSLAKCKTNLELERLRTESNLTLPWGLSQETSLATIAQSIIFEAATRAPVIGPGRNQIVQATSPARSWLKYYLPTAFITVATATGLLAYMAFRTGRLSWPRGEGTQIFGRKRFADYGDLGAALAGISLLNQPASNNVTVHPQDKYDYPARVEVEVETESVP